MQQVTGLVAVTGVFTSAIVLLYLFFNSRHKIRMALIESGKSADIFKEESSRFAALKYGMTAVGIGLGLLLGSALESETFPAPLPHFSMMLILGGGGLILYYLFVKKQEDGGDKTV
ncbi:MAG: hypothetical protein EPO28_10950 [Saprospiraceae bacterium]|nr:MAG: hypothetical protein EPO28_10950 [Saprospiraceae bacterium]